jgi:hypothetical protein
MIFSHSSWHFKVSILRVTKLQVFSNHYLWLPELYWNDNEIHLNTFHGFQRNFAKWLWEEGIGERKWVVLNCWEDRAVLLTPEWARHFWVPCEPLFSLELGHQQPPTFQLCPGLRGFLAMGLSVLKPGQYWEELTILCASSQTHAVTGTEALTVTQQTYTISVPLTSLQPPQWNSLVLLQRIQRLTVLMPSSGLHSTQDITRDPSEPWMLPRGPSCGIWESLNPGMPVSISTWLCFQDRFSHGHAAVLMSLSQFWVFTAVQSCLLQPVACSEPLLLSRFRRCPPSTPTLPSTPTSPIGAFTQLSPPHCHSLAPNKSYPVIFHPAPRAVVRKVSSTRVVHGCAGGINEWLVTQLPGSHA